MYAADELYDQDAEMDAVYCDICGYHHEPQCDGSESDDE